MQYDKPFLTYDEQIKRLEQNYNLHIADYDFAKTVLNTISYHSLINGYKEIFTKNGNLSYNIDIVYLYTLYKFDRDFQNILLKYSIYVENSFKTKMAYAIAKNISVDHIQYLDAKHYVNAYSRKKNINSTLSNLSSVYNNSNGYIDQPTKHYKNGKNHIPPWILFKNANFTDVIDLYSFLNKNIKDDVCMQYRFLSNATEPNKKLLKDSITIVRKFRNKIAHDLKFVSYKSPKDEGLIIKDVTNIPYINILVTHKDFKKYGRGSNDILAMIVSIYILLDDKYTCAEFITELISFINSKLNQDNYNVIWEYYCQLTSLPNDLPVRLEKFFNNLSQ